MKTYRVLNRPPQHHDARALCLFLFRLVYRGGKVLLLLGIICILFIFYMRMLYNPHHQRYHHRSSFEQENLQLSQHPSGNFFYKSFLGVLRGDGDRNGQNSFPEIEVARNLENDLLNYSTSSSLDPLPQNIVNPHPFKFLIKPQHACVTEKGWSIHVLIYVHSAAANHERRDEIRRTWGSRNVMRSHNATVVFILGKVAETSVMSRVKEESDVYNDIVQEDFHDTYHNLSRKAVSALKWTSIFCSQVAYILKTDDDVVVNIEAVMKFLHDVIKTRYEHHRLIVCNLWKTEVPQRLQTLKWYVPFEQWKEEVYPPFCQGMAYLLSGDLAAELYRVSLVTPFLWLDDVYVTGVLARELGINHVPLNHLYSPDGKKPKLDALFQHKGLLGWNGTG